MEETGFLYQAFVFLAVAVIGVPIAKQLGLGGLQVVITSLLLILLALAFDMHWKTALAIGMILALFNRDSIANLN